MEVFQKLREWTRPLTLPAMAVAAFAVGAAQARAETYHLPVIGETPGANSSYWDTAVQLTNLTANPNIITIDYFGAANLASGETTVTLAPGETRTLEGLLTEMGVKGVGAATMTTDGPVAGGARIFNRDANGGTQGQGVPLVNDADLYQAGETATAGLAGDISHYRSNIGWFQRDAGDVRFTLYDNLGNQVAQVTKTYADHEQRQDGAATWFGGAVSVGDNYRVTAEVISGRGTGQASIIDNTTNDPTTKNFTKINTAVSSNYDIGVWIQVIDNGQGYAQTTHPSEEIVKSVWQVHDIATLVGSGEYVCNDLPGTVVNTLPKVIKNYNGLTPEQQQEFSGDRNGFSPFANDSDNDGLPCDTDEPDHQYVNIIRLTVTPK